MKRLVAWLLNPPVSAPKATIVIRLMAGGVFLWEGILKFVYKNQGVGRFTKIGIPAPRHGSFRRRAGNPGGNPLDRRLPDAPHRDPVCDRDASCHSLDEDRVVSGDVAAASSSSAPHGGDLGRFA